MRKRAGGMHIHMGIVILKKYKISCQRDIINSNSHIIMILRCNSTIKSAMYFLKRTMSIGIMGVMWIAGIYHVDYGKRQTENVCALNART